MFFRSLSLLATFACAGLTIAAPLGDELANPLGNSASIPKLDTSVLPKVPRSPVDTTVVTGALANAGDVAKLPTLPARDVAHPTLPEILKTVAVKVTPIANKLKFAVATKGQIESAPVPDLIDAIVDVLLWANGAAQYVVDHPDELEFTIDGVAVTLDEVSAYTTGYLYVVLTTLAEVDTAVDGHVQDDVTPRIRTVGSNIADLLTRTFTVTPALLEYVTPGAKGLVQTIVNLNVANIIVALHLG